MNEQAIRILRKLPTSQLITMHQELVHERNEFYYENDVQFDGDDYVEHILQRYREDIYLLNFLIHDNHVQDVMDKKEIDHPS